MFNIVNLNKAIKQFAIEKEIDYELVKKAVESSLASAYKKEFERKGEIIRCEINENSNEASFYQIKIVVDKNSVRFLDNDSLKDENIENKKIDGEDNAEQQLPIFNEKRHIFLDDALKINKDISVGDEVKLKLPDPPKEFGRIAAQTAKQVILQKMREIEKDIIKKEFENKIGELVNGSVQRIERGNVYVDLGKATGIMFFSEIIPGEHYRIGERLKFYLLSVQENKKMPMLILSRSHPKFVSKLFELEVPEIAEGIVVIKRIAREPGNRTKIAVMSTVDEVDPVGACVGQRGARVIAINNEIFNEKIDIIEWSDNPEEFISASLSPAQVSSVELISSNTALVLVPEDQLSLAIGKGGQNVRLAAMLTGWKIDVRSQSNPDEVQEGGVASVSEEDGNKIGADLNEKQDFDELNNNNIDENSENLESSNLDNKNNENLDNKNDNSNGVDSVNEVDNIDDSIDADKDENNDLR